MTNKLINKLGIGALTLVLAGSLGGCNNENRIVRIVEFPFDAPGLKIESFKEYDKQNRVIFEKHDHSTNGVYEYSAKREVTYNQNEDYQETLSYDRNGDYVFESIGTRKIKKQK